MLHVNVDVLNEAVRHFVLQLAGEASGVVLDVGGRSVVCVLPFPPDNNEVDEPWTESKNARRCELIDKEIAGTLDLSEAIELEQLQQAARREAQRVAPLPMEGTRALYRQLLDKARNNNSGTE